MLAIRLQRRGRKGHAHFRVIVQESRLSPKSGRVVASLGSYDPHTKLVTLDTEKAEFYLSNGAQPSTAAAKLLEREKVKLPDWVEIDRAKARTTKDPEKLRKNQPKEEKEEAAPAEEVSSEENAEATPTEDTAEADDSVDDKPAADAGDEASAEK